MLASPSGAVALDSASITLPTPSRRQKGGMCVNPTGGFDRLDRIDLLDYASGDDSPFKLLMLKIIQQALQDFLFYGLGKNGTTRQGFLEAARYFFEIRSTIPTTWNHARIINEVVMDAGTGKRKRRIIQLSDEELHLMCFDRQYQIAELDKSLPFDRFVLYLEEQRFKILSENWMQVKQYLKVPDADEFEALRELVMPSAASHGPCKIPSRRHRACISMPAHKHEPQASALGSNGVLSDALMEAA